MAPYFSKAIFLFIFVFPYRRTIFVGVYFFWLCVTFTLSACRHFHPPTRSQPCLPQVPDTPPSGLCPQLLLQLQEMEDGCQDWQSSAVRGFFLTMFCPSHPPL